MDVVYDTADGTLRIDAVGPLRAGCFARAKLDRHGQKRVNIRGVRFKLDVKVDGVTRHTVEMPPPHIRYEFAGGDVIHQTRVPYDAWKPDEEVRVDAELWRVDGSRVTATKTFVGERPDKRYDSWVWDAEKGRYMAPVAEPEEEAADGKYWAWDEPGLEWVQKSAEF